GKAQTLTEARYARFSRALNELEGWSGRLRADFGHAAADFVVEHRLVASDASDVKAAVAAIKKLPKNGYEREVVGTSDGGITVRVVEIKTSAARNVKVPAELLASPMYANLR